MEYTFRYQGIILKEEIRVEKLYTIHYFENYKNYFFPGERHDFWEIVYVDRGEIIVETDLIDCPITLEQGDLIIHRPNEFHRFYANDITPHNLFVISFQSHSPAMRFFNENPLHHMKSEERSDISKIIHEAKKCFSASLQDPNVEFLIPRTNAPLAGEQVIKLTLELILIKLCRKENTHTEEDALHGRQEKLSKSYVDKAVEYLKASLQTKVHMEDICTYVGVSRSQLQKMFLIKKEKTVMQYLRELRIEEAKFMIRRQNANFTEISEQLAYSTIHHFSRQFKEITGMSPTEYAESIHELTETLELHQKNTSIIKQ